MDDISNQFSPSFENISMFQPSYTSITGRASFIKFAISYGLYFVENDVSTPNPFVDPYTLNPFSEPYINSDGHHLLDLKYYSEITIIEEFPRICFHDATQEPGIVFNFRSKEEYQIFLSYLKSSFTMLSSTMQGFFKIKHFQPQIFDSNFIKERISAINSANDLDFEKKQAIFSAHSKIIKEIAPQGLNVQAPDSELNQAFESKIKMTELLQKYSIPDDRKADVWLFLTGISPLEKLDEKRFNDYLNLREQWSSLTQSQWERSNLIREQIEQLSRAINQNKNKLLTIAGPSIIKVVFNVIMSICHLYNDLHTKHNELIQLIQVFLWMFISPNEDDNDNRNSLPNEHRYHSHKKGVIFTSDHLEGFVFWSYIYLLEKCEIRNLLTTPDKDRKTITQPVNDIIHIIHPCLYKLFQIRGLDNFEQLTPLLTMCFSTALTSCNCADVWLAAISTEHPLDFIQCMIVSSLLFNFPNIWQKSEMKADLLKLIDQAFLSLDHYYIEGAAFIILKKAKTLALNCLNFL